MFQKTNRRKRKQENKKAAMAIVPLAQYISQYYHVSCGFLVRLLVQWSVPGY